MELNKNDKWMKLIKYYAFRTKVMANHPTKRTDVAHQDTLTLIYTHTQKHTHMFRNLMDK